MSNEKEIDVLDEFPALSQRLRGAERRDALSAVLPAHRCDPTFGPRGNVWDKPPRTLPIERLTDFRTEESQDQPADKRTFDLYYKVSDSSRRLESLAGAWGFAGKAKEQRGTRSEPRPIWEIVVEIGASVPDEEWAKVPTDLAENLDHYLYGTPKDKE